MGKTWFANHNISEREQIRETPECQSGGDRPELPSSSEGPGNLPGTSELRTDPSNSKQMFSSLHFTSMRRRGQVCPAAPFCESLGKCVNHLELHLLVCKMGIKSLAVS